MFKAFRQSPNIQLCVIAFSLVMATTVLGLSAYLTDTQTYSGTFRTASGTELGFQLTGETYDDTLVIPGDTIPVNAIASISQPNDLYLFVEIDASSAFKLEGFKSAYWRPVSEDSNTYYYGTANALVPLGIDNGSTIKIQLHAYNAKRRLTYPVFFLGR